MIKNIKPFVVVICLALILPALTSGADIKADYGFAPKTVTPADIGLKPKQVYVTNGTVVF